MMVRYASRLLSTYAGGQGLSFTTHDRTNMGKLLLISLGVWASTCVLYIFGILLAASLLEYAQTSTAEVAALVLIAAEFLVACIAVAYVFVQARRSLQRVTSLLWAAAFVLLQFATCALAMFATLLVLNR
jgi:hypothetical protein